MDYLKFLLPVLLFGCIGKSQQDISDQVIISEREIDNIEFRSNTLYLNIPDVKGDTLALYTDTGGGNIIYPETITRLSLTIDSTSTNGNVTEQVNINKKLNQTGAPSTIGPSFVFRQDSPLKEGNGGVLGTHWFADKVWHFKYKEEKLFIVDSLNWNKADQSKTVKLGFLKKEDGTHLTHFPRIPVVIEGDTIQTLFDTGAHTFLSDVAKTKFGDKHSVATSFIIAGIFDKWHSENPNWKYIEGGDSFTNEAMIQVPKVKLGNYEVGPVWFTRRSDKNFTEYMSQWMDQKVYGAIGGSAFKYFDSIILDYGNELAYFEK